MSYTEEYIRNKLIKELDATHVEVVDESDGCGGKFSCVIVADKFKGKTSLQRHRRLTAPSSGTSKKAPETMSSSSGFTVSASAPGKVILFGEHSVVYGKLALAASLGLRTRLTLTEQQHDAVIFNFRTLNFTRTYPLEALRSGLLAEPHPEEFLVERVRNFIITHGDFGSQTELQSLACALYLLVAVVGQLLRPFTLTVTTDLNVSSGLGSSASFSVALAAAFLRYRRFLDGVEAEGDLEEVSRWAYAAEKIIHGTPSGLDTAVCTYGSIVEFQKGLSPKLLVFSHKLQVLLINTKIPRDTKALVAKVAALRETFPEVVGHILNAMDEVAKAALRSLQGSGDEIGVLSDVNQNLLRSLGVSHASLDSVCSVLSAAGLHGKLTGAGGGGYAIAIVPPTFQKAVVDNVLEKLIEMGFDAVLTDLGGPGVQVL